MHNPIHCLAPFSVILKILPHSAVKFVLGCSSPRGGDDNRSMAEFSRRSETSNWWTDVFRFFLKFMIFIAASFFKKQLWYD